MQHFFKIAFILSLGISVLTNPVKASWKGRAAEEICTKRTFYLSRGGSLASQYFFSRLRSSGSAPLMGEYDLLREAEESGIEKGKKEGFKEGKKYVAIRLLMERSTPDKQIQELADLSPEELAELKNKMRGDD